MTTNFKPWDEALTNVETDAAYLSDTMRLNGATAGVFPSATANKLFMQVANMAAALAESLGGKGYTVEDGSAGTVGHDYDALVAVLAKLATAIDIQTSAFVYAADTGAANAYAAPYSPALGTLVNGSQLRFLAAHANTGASTFSPNGLTAKPILSAQGYSLEGGEIAASSRITVEYSGALDSWILTSGAAKVPVTDATASHHAVAFGQHTALKANPGYKIDPTGIITQFGSIDVLGGSGGAVQAYPIAFPNGLMSVVANVNDPTSLVNAVTRTDPATVKSQVTLDHAGGAVLLAITWIAIGW